MLSNIAKQILRKKSGNLVQIFFPNKISALHRKCQAENTERVVEKKLKKSGGDEKENPFRIALGFFN